MTTEPRSASHLLTLNFIFTAMALLALVLGTALVPAAPAQAVAGPVVTNINPSSGKAGDAITLTITGTGFLLAEEVWIRASDGEDIVDTYLPNFTINSDTQITISFTIPADAVPGETRTRIYDASSYGNSYYGFTVLGPYIDSMEPGNAKQGQTLSVVLTGGGFTGATGATAVSFSGTGITVTGFNVDSDTQITAAVTVAADATLGDRDISVTTPDGTGTKSGDFTIFAASSPGWVIETVDTGTSNGFEYPSIAMDSSNRPHISYYDSDNEDLKYASYNGTAWVKETVDSAGSVGMFSSLTLDGSGKPRIAYYDATNYALKFARWTGSAWQIMTVDNAGSADGVGFNGISLALDGAGCPHIAYYDKNNLTLKYGSNTSDPFNTASWVTETVPDVSGGLGCSLALDSGGNAHISYHRNGDSVYYVYQSGGTWQAPLQVSTGRGYYPSLDLDSSGSPHISYGANDGIIRYASNPSSWIIREVQSTNMGGARSSLALDSTSSQYAHIFYYDQNTYFLGYASDNSTAFPYQVVEGGIFPNVGSLALDGNNNPHVAYQGSSATLKHAYYSGGATPTVTAVNPSSGQQGQTIDSAVITGTNLTSASAVSFGAGITVNSFTINSATQVTANITIAAGAATGTRNVSVTTGGGTGTGNNLFAVTAPTPTPTPAPTVTSVSPNAGTWGETLAVTITGTNFTGATSISLGTGITATFTVISPTQISATIVIAPGTAVGARSVTVTTPQGPGTGGSFTVIPNPAAGGTQSNGRGGGSGGSGGGNGNGTQGISPMSMPNIVVQSATVSATSVAPGEAVTITANLANRGTANGTTAVKVYVNGQEEAAQGITVNSGSNRPVIFTVSRSEPGTYSVYVGGVSAGSFTVESDSSIILFISIAMVFTAIAMGMVYFTRRKRSF